MGEHCSVAEVGEDCEDFSVAVVGEDFSVTEVGEDCSVAVVGEDCSVAEVGEDCRLLTGTRSSCCNIIHVYVTSVVCSRCFDYWMLNHVVCFISVYWLTEIGGLLCSGWR